jgi:hypothetical protein
MGALAGLGSVESWDGGAVFGEMLELARRGDEGAVGEQEEWLTDLGTGRPVELSRREGLVVHVAWDELVRVGPCWLRLVSLAIWLCLS